MYQLTDDAIDSAIDSISGYIVARVAAEADAPICEVTEAFVTSRAYGLLCDKETGYYWDSILELIGIFKDECGFFELTG